VSWINARRRRPVAGYAALLLGLVVVGLLYGAFTRTGGSAQASSPGPSQSTSIRARTCSTRPARAATASTRRAPRRRPSLIGAGAAAVDFQMSTGRMPAKEVGAENDRKPVTFSAQQIYEIADYVASLGGGPRSRRPAGVHRGSEHRARGRAVQRQLRAVPRLRRGGRRADLRQVRAAADRGDPDADLRGDADRARGDAGVRRRRGQPVGQARHHRLHRGHAGGAQPGGFSLGRTGPVTEGLVIFLGGMGFLVLIALWITAKRRDPRPTGTE
jgi:ubiquinol-cytochrome c reductase cytochrome c subunit